MNSGNIINQVTSLHNPFFFYAQFDEVFFPQNSRNSFFKDELNVLWSSLEPLTLNLT